MFKSNQWEEEVEATKGEKSSQKVSGRKPDFSPGNAGGKAFKRMLDGRRQPFLALDILLISSRKERLFEEKIVLRLTDLS